MDCNRCHYDMDLISEFREDPEDNDSKAVTKHAFLCMRCFSYSIEIYEDGVGLRSVISGDLRRRG